MRLRTSCFFFSFLWNFGQEFKNLKIAHRNFQTEFTRTNRCKGQFVRSTPPHLRGSLSRCKGLNPSLADALEDLCPHGRNPGTPLVLHGLELKPSSRCGPRRGASDWTPGASVTHAFMELKPPLYHRPCPGIPGSLRLGCPCSLALSHNRVGLKQSDFLPILEVIHSLGGADLGGRCGRQASGSQHIPAPPMTLG